MSIANDPSQWTSKPKDNTMSKSLVPHTLREYHLMRDTLIHLYHNSSSSSTRRLIRSTLETSNAERDEEGLL